MNRSEGKHVCMLPSVPSCCGVPPTAGSHSYWMCRLRALRLPWSHHAGAVRHVRSPARLRAERARMRGVSVHPYSAACLYAHAVHAFLTLALLIYAPFQVFIECPDPYDPWLLSSDVLSCAAMCASLTTGYVDDDNKLIVLDPRRVAAHYLRTRFIADLIGALPLQIIHLFDNCRYPSHTIMLILKIFRLPTFNKEARNLLEQMGLSYVSKKIITVVIKVLLFFHWMTYIHYQVPCFAIHYFQEDEQYKVWLKRFIIVNIEHNSIFQKYTANLFLVCGLCIGAGYYNPVDEHQIFELILTASMGLIGLVFLTCSISTLLRLAIYRQHEQNLFNGRARELKEYMNFKRLPKFLQKKIQLFINYKYNGHYFKEEVIMSTINEQIKQDINMHACKRMVMAVPLFQDMPIALINAIIFNLTKVLFMPGELLVKCGQPGNSLYMISSGTVAVMSATAREIAHLRDGAYFGETALLHPGTTRNATIIALEITEIYKLDSKSFRKCAAPYPHLWRRLADTLRRRRLL